MTPREISKNISINLRYLRKKKKKAQKQVIEEIGDFNLSLRSYSTYENGDGDMPSLEKLVLLADYYGCSIDFLIRGIDNTPDNSFMLVDNLKRMSFLIYSMCLVPVEQFGTKECKYGFISYDKELELFIDKINSLSKEKNYMFDYQNTKVEDLIDNYIEIVNEFKNFNNDQKPTLERANRLLLLDGIEPDMYMKQRQFEHEIKQKKNSK